MKNALTAIIFMIASSPTLASDYYKVQVTRKSDNLYEIVGQNMYIVTRFCFEFVHFSDAVLKIDSTVGYTIGEIIFVADGGGKCDIEKLLR